MKLVLENEEEIQYLPNLDEITELEFVNYRGNINLSKFKNVTHITIIGKFYTLIDQLKTLTDSSMISKRSDSPITFGKT